MTAPCAALAVPGDLGTATGGYFYDRRLLAELRTLGWEVSHIALAAAFPDPSAADNRDAAERLAAVRPSCPVIIDGLALGAMDSAVLRGVTSPIVALVHHPLALESGLDATRCAALLHSERDNLALAAHVIVTSSHTAALLRSRYDVAPECITVARPGSDRPREQAAPADPPLVLSVGTQTWRKGHDVLLRALARVADRPWRAVIVGGARDAAQAEGLLRLRAQLGLADRVHLAGEVSAEELARLYRQATLFALATRYEGYGIVFDEAMVHGLPIVSCAAGAVPDTVAPGAGQLVPPDDVEAFVAALARVLDDPAARSAMAAASAAAGTALPGWDSTARVVANVLKGLVKRG